MGKNMNGRIGLKKDVSLLVGEVLRKYNESIYLEVATEEPLEILGQNDDVDRINGVKDGGSREYSSPEILCHH
jgi:hypothetical protein